MAYLLFLSSPAGAQEPHPSRERFPKELDAYISKVLVDWKIPGIGIAVVRNDSVMVAKGYGVRELGKPGPVDENTVFDIASIAKSFTATVAAILVDRGVLRWDDPVHRYLPDLLLPNQTLTDSATIRDFLSHRTGIEAANMMWVPSAVDRAGVLRRMRNLRTPVPPRQEMLYSNIGYVVAGEAIAAAAGVPLEQLFRDLLIKPLHLASTTWTYEQAGRMPNVAASHARLAGLQQPIRREKQRRTIAAAAAIQSTMSDLTRWMRLHLNNGVLDGVRYLSDSAMRELHSRQVGIPTTPAMRAFRMVQGDSSSVGYGLGWQVMDYRGHFMNWHSGNGNGQIAYMSLLPQDRLGVVVVVNTWAAPLVHGAIVNRILDTYLGYEPRDWAKEGFPRQAEEWAAQDSAARAMAAMRDAAGPVPLPLDRYTGRYDHPVFGPLLVRLSHDSLSLQMGEGGQVADLEYHGGDAFFTRWRDPFFREFFGTHARFPVTDGKVDSLRMRLNRDEFTAVRVP